MTHRARCVQSLQGPVLYRATRSVKFSLVFDEPPYVNTISAVRVSTFFGEAGVCFQIGLDGNCNIVPLLPRVGDVQTPNTDDAVRRDADLVRC